MSAQANAIVFRYSHDAGAALPPHTSIALVEATDMIEVPATPYYGNRLLRWQDKLLPVLDLHPLLKAEPIPNRLPERHLLVVAYQSSKYAAIEYGALCIVGLPTTVAVTDEMACALPPNSDYWPVIALSCFMHDGQPTPVLDTARLFASHV
jgi:chemotaxis protein histidine kinase CheA